MLFKRGSSILRKRVMVKFMWLQEGDPEDRLSGTSIKEHL